MGYYPSAGFLVCPARPVGRPADRLAGLAGRSGRQPADPICARNNSRSRSRSRAGTSIIYSVPRERNTAENPPDLPKTLSTVSLSINVRANARRGDLVYNRTEMVSAGSILADRLRGCFHRQRRRYGPSSSRSVDICRCHFATTKWRARAHARYWIYLH